MKDVGVLFLAGGFGTRIAKFYPNTPKALLEINDDKRLLDFLIDKVRNELLNSRINLISNEKYYSSFNGLGINVVNNKVTSNEERLGSIGDILYFLDQEKPESDLVVIGTDNYFEEDLSKIVGGENVKIMAYDCGDLELARKYGTVILNEEGNVLEFDEKPVIARTSLVSTMIYYIPESKLDLFNKFRDDNPDLLDRAGNFLMYLNSLGETIEVLVTKKNWFDIGSIEELDRLRETVGEKQLIKEMR